jgi:hypothetical protein
MQSDRRLLEKRINRLFTLTLGVQDDELRAELTKHLCVLSSGLLELGCREILSRYSAKRCSPQVLRAIESFMASFQNPKVGKIIDLLSQFDPNKATNWRRRLSDEEADSVDSIVSNRHQIAHGRSIGLSISVLQYYHANASKALLALEQEFPPH